MESVKDMYLTLMRQGMKLHEIDAMDFLFYLELQRHAIKQEEEQNTAMLDTMGF